MRIAQTLIIAFCLVSTACNQQQEISNSDKKDLNALFKRYWDERARLFPLDATAEGDNRYNNLLRNDISKPFRDSLKLFYSRYLTELSATDTAALNANDRISYDIMEYDLQTRLEGLKLNTWMMPFNQFWGVPITMGQLGSGDGNQPFKTEKDYQNWLGRVDGFTVWADTAVTNFRKGIRAGVVLPKPLVEKMIGQMQAMVVANAEKSLFYGPVKKFPKGMNAAAKTRMTSLYKQAILTKLVPAYQKLGSFLKTEYLPKARTSTGISAIPKGKAMYVYQVKFWTTTSKTPEEIYQTGLTEVKRIRAEMEQVKAKTGFYGNINDFFNYLRTDKRFTPFKSPQDVLNAFRFIQTKIEPNLKNMFGRTPKTSFEIRQTEAFRAASASAEYNQATADGSRPGIFYIPILDATKFNTTSGMESLFLHEAIPGHHYQISLQQENKDLPSFRRFGWYGAYGEGWALYTESLGKELGLYTDPYQYMGALGDEIHRAIRLVVDVGMHTKGMTRQQAITYMMENEAIDKQGAVAEIERYMAIPGQALSYKIGALKIRELRKKYENQLGDKFRLMDFHDEFLKDGCMPLDVAERKMDKWAAKQTDL